MAVKFDVETFVRKQTKEIKETLKGKKALIAASGGVDSTTCAALTLRSVGKNLICVFINDNFRRLGEPQSVVKMLSSLDLPVRLVDAREEFTKNLADIEDAEEKRKAFREAFYRTLERVAKEEKCEYLVQGTIAADWVETRGGIKTQHNVLSQIGINPMERYGFHVIEPLVYLYKNQVREVARHLRVPVAERQPFPGPGLAIRAVGAIYPEKLDVLKRATVIAEEGLAKERPEQYLAAVFEDETIDIPASDRMRDTAGASLGLGRENIRVKTLRSMATGVKLGKRAYGMIAIITLKGDLPGVPKLVELQEKLLKENPGHTRIMVEVKEGTEKAPFVAAIRAVKTENFITAEVANVPWNTLRDTADQIIRECKEVSQVCYDVTPKPPATIEFE